MSALCWSIGAANPSQLQLELLVLGIVLSAGVDDANGFLDGLLDREILILKIELFKLGLGGLTALS